MLRILVDTESEGNRNTFRKCKTTSAVFLFILLLFSPASFIFSFDKFTFSLNVFEWNPDIPTPHAWHVFESNEIQSFSFYLWTTTTWGGIEKTRTINKYNLEFRIWDPLTKFLALHFSIHFGGGGRCIHGIVLMVSLFVYSKLNFLWAQT